MNKRILCYSLFFLTILTTKISACFDTYLFLEKQSMVYPKGQIVIDGAGEYLISKMQNSQLDQFTGNANIYYGFHKKFSLQVGIHSDEKHRANFSIDGYGVKGVYGIFQNLKNLYNLDMILEHHAPFDHSNVIFELSAPNIFHIRNFTFVAHPVFGFDKSNLYELRGHGGAFYRFNQSGIIGLGAEYASSQTGNYFGRRLIDGEFGTSFFLGSKIGTMYMQNEFIKGWKNGNDFGFATTLKFTFSNFQRDN